MGKYAFATFVMRNDSFIPGALVLSHALRVQNTKADLVCLVTKDITEIGKDVLKAVFDHVICIDEITVSHSRHHQRQDRPYLFTRLQALRLGSNGGLGVAYDKVVLLDADILPIYGYDDLFKINTPAGILNVEKSNFVEPSKVHPIESGKLLWHDRFEPICPHGRRIPKEITDAVKHDATNLGVNACLWVLEPCALELEQILDSLRHPSAAELISVYNWPEMQYMTAFWSGLWHNVDIRYASFNAQPCLSSIKGTHFAGLKPWDEKHIGSIAHYSRFDDYQLWYSTFEALCKWHAPSVVAHPKVRRLLAMIEKNRQNR